MSEELSGKSSKPSLNSNASPRFGTRFPNKYERKHKRYPTQLVLVYGEKTKCDSLLP